MGAALVVDRNAVSRICATRGVRRLSLFGSGTGTGFDAERSDVDLLVEFAPGNDDPFDAYFGLKEDLEDLFGREVDLVMTGAVRNPHFLESARATAQELYAA